MSRIAILAIFSFVLAASNALAFKRYPAAFDDDIIPDLPEYSSVYDDNVAYGVDSRIARPQTQSHPQAKSWRTTREVRVVQPQQPQMESIVTTKPNPFAAFFAPSKYKTVATERISSLDEESSVTVIVPPPAPKVVAKPKKPTTKKTTLSSTAKKPTSKAGVKSSTTKKKTTTTSKPAAKKPSTSSTAKKPTPKPAVKKSTTPQKKPAPKR